MYYSYLGEARTTEGDSREARSDDGVQPNIKLYIVVACIAALVLVAVMQASCTIYKLTKRPSMHTVGFWACLNTFSMCFKKYFLFIQPIIYLLVS